MSDHGFKYWSDSPNAPKIVYRFYLAEKADLAGYFLTPILYGMLIVLFFKCITALLNPIYRAGECVRWGLASYTVVMFSLATVLTAMNLDIESISRIDNRNFPGIARVVPPGPLGYIFTIYLKAINIVPNVAFLVSNWLADGFLLYRCYVIYSTNLWVITFPCLMYLSSVSAYLSFPRMEVTLKANVNKIVMGLLAVVSWLQSIVSFAPFISISISLNVTLTLMIALRLVLRGRNVRVATGSRAGTGGLYKTIATIFIESCALFAVSSLIVVGSMSSEVGYLAFPILNEIQTIAPLLIIQRIANRSALTSTTIPGSVLSSFRARSRWDLTGGSGALHSEHSMGPIGQRMTDSGEDGIWVETRADSHRDEV